MDIHFTTKLADQKEIATRQLFDEKHLLHTLIDNMPDFIYIKDTDSKFIVANQKLIDVHHLKSRDQLIGKSDHDFYPKELADKYFRNEQTIIRTGKPLINHEERSLDEKGGEIYLSTTKIPLHDGDGKIIGIVGIGRDITDRRKADEKLLDHADQLQHINALLEEKQEEIQQQSEALSAQADNLRLANQELEKANITKDKFFSIIAHDLKNPFHSILGFTDLLIKNYHDFEDIKKLEFLGLINESSQYANNLLDNLLHWSRTQTDRIRYSPIKFDLHSLINEIQHMLHANVEKKQLALLNLVPEATYVYADKNMIHTVLRNLVSNSIKFTPEEGTISFQAIPEGDHVRVSVEDNGVGISLDKQDKLFSFSEFYSTAGTAGEPGTGLGLIICFEFIKKHQGKLRFYSESGKGTTFIFNLPGQEPSVRV